MRRGKQYRQKPLALFMGLSLCAASWAQPAAPADPPRTPAVVPSGAELSPRRAVAPSQAELPAAPMPPPRELGKPEDSIRVDVLRYEVDDSAPAALKARLAELTAPFVGPGRSFEDLYNARVEVTRFLQSELGYYLGYAYVPEQTLTGGVVRIAVLEGRLDKVVTRWPSGRELPVRRDVVQAYLDHLKEGSILLVRDVERVVFLVNDLLGLRARFEVTAGSRPGTANIEVDFDAAPRWSARADADANGSRFLGEYRVAGQAQWASPLGRGDALTANIMRSTTGGLNFALLGYASPVGSNGMKLGVSLSAVQYQLDKAVFPLDLNGSATTLTAYGLHPFVRSRNLNLFTVLSAEQKTYEDRQDVASSRSRKSVSTLSLGLTGDLRDNWLGGGVNTFDASLVSGRVHYPDGRPGGLEDAANFNKLVFGFSRLQDLLFVLPTLQDRNTGKMLAYASLRGQWAFANLDTTEQMRLGGPDAVRAFASGEAVGDDSLVASLEARLLPPESWFGRYSSELVLSAFVDHGVVRYRHQRLRVPAGALPNTGQFTAVGLGMTWVRPGEYAMRLSLAVPVSGIPRNDTKERKPRLYLQATRFFN